MLTPGKLNRRAAFFEQLATMISAGIPLSKALEMAGRSPAAGVPQKIVHELTDRLNEGHTFTDAMQIVSGQLRPDGTMDVMLKPRSDFWLSEFDVALLSAGEQSGKLDSAFRLLARYCTSRAKIIRDLIFDLLLTIVTIHVFLIVFPPSFLVAFVVGVINGDYGPCMWFITEKVLVFGFLYGSVWFLMFASQSNRGENWRAAAEGFYNIFPFLRLAVKYLAIARLSMALDVLLNAGVPVVRAWRLAASSCGSPRLKSEVMRFVPQIEQGISPAEMVAQIRYFPEMFANLYHTGEISGRMDESLPRLHAYFEEEGFRQLKVFCNIVNYVLYFTVAGVIGWFVIHFYVNYFSQALNMMN